MNSLRVFYEKRLFGAKSPIIQWVLSILRWVYRTRIAQLFVYRFWQNDEAYLKVEYKRRFGRKLNLIDPKTFNEKNNWRKLYDRKPVYVQMVDKFKFKEFVETRVGPGNTIKLLGSWRNPEDIDFDSLPSQFVLKPNHSGGIVICRDKSSFDKVGAIKKLRKAMKVNYYIRSREWPYKNVERCIIAEEYKGENLWDYKNYVFNGKLLYTLVWKNVPNGNEKPKAYFCGMYDRQWNRTDMELDYPSLSDNVDCPTSYEEMVRIAEKLAEGTIFVRSDFFIIDDKPFAGEMTFFPWGGFQKFKNEEWNERLGALEILPVKQ